MNEPISHAALNQIFIEARTHTVWQNMPVSNETLRKLYDLAKMGPTSANCSPARFVFITTLEAKARLVPALMPGNIEKTKSAPVTVIVAYDVHFFENLPSLWPHGDMKSMYVQNPGLAQETAFRNGSLAGGYMILAARSLGLDCGPMSGFDQGKVNAEFFADGKWKSNFLINLGYGDQSKLKPRGPRLSFDEACKIL